MRRTFAGPDMARNVAMNATSEISNVPSTAITIRAVRERKTLFIGHTDVALTPDGSDGGPAHGFELPPQVAHVHIERSFVRRRLALIQHACKLVARHDPANGSHQYFENRQFGGRQFDWHTAVRDGTVEGIDL